MTLPMVLLTYLAVLAFPAVAGPTHAVDWITRIAAPCICFGGRAGADRGRGVRAGVAQF